MSWVETLDRHRRGLAALVLASAVACLPVLLRAGVDNSLEVWVDREGAAFQEYQRFRGLFGSEEFILLVYELPKAIDGDFLFWLTDLRLSLEEVAGVRRVDCLSRIYGRFFTHVGPQAFDREARASPFFHNLFVSDDGRWGAQWLALDIERPADRGRIVGAARGVVERQAGDRDVHLAGSPVLTVALDESSRRAARTFFPLVFVLSAAVLLLLFRSVWGLVIPFASVGVGIGWTLALLVGTGHALNMVTVTLPPVVWVLGLSTSIHLLSRCRRRVHAGLAPEEAVRQTLATVARPCLFSAVTTAAGFSSLVASSMTPVREMGVFAALGVLLCLASNVLLFPLLARWGVGSLAAAAGGEETRRPFLGRIAALTCRRSGAVLGVSALAGLLLAAGVARLRVESNVLEFFKEDAPIAVTYKRVLRDFTGPYSLEIVVTPPAGLDAATVLATVEDLDRFVEARPEVARVLSLADLVGEAARLEGGPPPAGEEGVRAALGRVEERMAEEARSFRAPGGELRLSVLARVMGSREHGRLVAAIERHLAATLDPAWRPRLTGIVRLAVETQEELLRSQIASFGLAFGVIVPVIGLLLRSWRAALLAIPPNLFPILFALGGMGFAGIPLDPATVMIAGVSLGIATNDTLHFLEHYRRARGRSASREGAVEETLQAVGRPFILTSAVAAVGFFVLAFSDFRPLLYFGVLTGLTLGAALAGDLLILPAMIGFRGRERR